MGIANPNSSERDEPHTEKLDRAAAILTKKLAEVMAASNGIPKSGHNREQNYDYHTESDVSEAIRELLAERHVMLIPSILQVHRGEPRQTKRGGTIAMTSIELDMTFLDGETGYERVFPWAGDGDDTSDKGLQKAITNGVKYFLMKTFLLPTDDDAEKDSHETTQGRSQAAERPSAKPEVQASGPPADTSHRVQGKLYVEEVESVSGDKKDGSGRWTKHNVTFSDGQQASTFNGPLANDCEEYRKSQAPVKIMTTPAANPKWNDTLEACEPDEELTSSDIPF